MATSGRKKASKTATPKKRVTKYEDGSQSVSWSSKYKAATPTGASNRSAVAKKPAKRPAKFYMVSDYDSAMKIAGREAVLRGRAATGAFPRQAPTRTGGFKQPKWNGET